VDHLFVHRSEEPQPTITPELGISPDEGDAEGIQAEWPWVDDVTYEDIDNTQGFSDYESVTSGGSHSEVAMDHELTAHYDASINGHKVDPVNIMNSSKKPYLDWALIEFDNGYFERPNLFYSEEDPLHPKFLTSLSAAPKTTTTHVLMISGVRGTRKGIMLNGNSYLGGKPGEELCQTWNVILSDSDRELRIF